MSNFWDLLWLMFSAFMFVAYLFVMLQVVADLFRDSELGGFSKALWIIGLILLPKACSTPARSRPTNSPA